MTATISQVEVFSVGMPLVGTFTSGGASKNTTKCIVVRITATDGAVGISSIDPSTRALSPNTAPELAVAIRERLGPALIKEDPGNVNRIFELASKLTGSHRSPRPGPLRAVAMAANGEKSDPATRTWRCEGNPNESLACRPRRLRCG